jgi:hypothetical protein
LNRDNNLEVEELLEVGKINQNIDFKTRMTELLDINIPILLHIETKANHQEFSLLMSGQDFSLLISDQDFSLLISGQDIIHQLFINQPHVIDVDGRDTWR